jgi:CHAT domain-containing protein
LILLGEYDRAFALSERAREIFVRLGEERRLASLENNVGNIFHRQDRFDEALIHYERAYKQLSQVQDWERLAITLSNMAMCLISLNDFPKALDCYQRAREFCVRYGFPLLRDQADYNIAYLYYFRGEYSRSIQMLKSARDACEKSGDAYHFALCHLDLSEIYLELNLSEEARQMAHEGNLQFQKLGLGYEAAKTLANEAIALGQQRMSVRSLEIFAVARAQFVREKNSVWPWLIDLYAALVLFNEGRFFESRRLCAKAVKFFDSSVLPGKAVLGHLLLARLALRTGEIATAKRESDDALLRLRSLESPVLRYQAYFLRGKIQEAAGDADNAYAAYQEARQALETLRSSLHAEELKINFMKNRLEVYERLVELCLSDANDPEAAEEAIGYVESAKSRSLTELIFQSGSPLPGGHGGHSDLVRRIQELREELNWYYHRIESEQLRPEERSPERIARLQARLKERENEFLRALREIPESGSESGGLQTPSCVPLRDIRANLSPGTVLIEYFSIGDRLIAAVVTPEGVEVVPVTLMSRVGAALRLLRLQFSKFNLGREYTDTFQDALLRSSTVHLQELHAELLAPLRNYLHADHVVIVPHGVLHYLPFHALHDGKRYLIDSVSVSYAPSASVFALCQQKASGGCKSSLILGVPDERAPFIADEVRTVAAILPNAELFVGQQANEQVLSEKGAHSRLVHIATHGSFRQDNPMFSGIRLGGSYLSLYDLYQLRLDADLVALSGCATGLNVVAAGDELLGLIRGLLFAGARSLLLSLWDVHDRTTADLMKAFYERFCEGENVAKALQHAMAQLRAAHPHPYYWAPFMLVGKVFP